MKKIKLLTTWLTVLALVLSLGISALAITPTATTETGTITIKNPVKKQSYYLYRIFNLESYDKESNAYSYTPNGVWGDFAKLVNGTYITLETGGEKPYVKWIKGADANAFAKEAIAWAKDNDVMINDGKTPLADGDVVFKNLPLGYYLIDSSVGALCALTTNDPNAEVNEKNELTTVVKLVKENSTNDYLPENTAKLGDTVSFKSEITLGEGAENLVLHDCMHEDLSLIKNSIKIYTQQSQVEAKNYTLDFDGEMDKVDGKHAEKNCTFHVVFDNDFIAKLNPGTVIRVEYDAVIKWDAKEVKTFDNETWVSFGDQLTSTHSTTNTYTYSFDMVKTNDKGVAIQTAKFYLYDAQKGGSIIPLVVISEDAEKGIYRYRVATADDQVEENGAPIKAGYAYVYGLDKQVYYLEEIEQPTGFNILSERVKVDLLNGDIKADTTGDFFHDGSVLGSVVSGAGGLQIINKAGTLLPSTGGFGTILFYVIGGLLAVGAGVLLITKKRMNKENH